MNLNKEDILLQPFFKLFLVYWFLAILLLLFSSRGDVLLWINNLSNPFVDKLFIYTTWMGHGTFGFLVALFLLIFYRISMGLQMGLTLILVSIFTNFAKRVIFFQHNRPMWVYDYVDLHHVISEIPLNYMRSFPSGHAMVAFGMAAAVSLMFRQKWIPYLMFLFAFWVSLSRVYLLQHFFVDVLWGAILGCIAAVVSALALNAIRRNDIQDRFGKSIPRLILANRERKFHKQVGE